MKRKAPSVAIRESEINCETSKELLEMIMCSPDFGGESVNDDWCSESTDNFTSNPKGTPHQNPTVKKSVDVTRGKKRRKRKEKRPWWHSPMETHHCSPDSSRP